MSCHQQIWLLLLFILSIVVVSCRNDNGLPPLPDQIPSATPEFAPLPTLQPRPDFVSAVTPLESQQLSLALLEADRTEEFLAATGILVNSSGDPDLGYMSQVCLTANLFPLAQIGDDFSDDQNVVNRVTFQVDNLILPEVTGWHTSLEAISLLDENEQVSIQGLGDMIFCGKINLDVGVHTILFQFRQTSGETKEYTWQFVIKDE